MTFSPFALVGDGLIYLPTPSAVHVRGYRDLFRRLHADEAFCQIAFGDHFKPVVWSDEEMKEFLGNDVKYCWDVKGMGDFALGLLPTTKQGGSPQQTYEGRLLTHAKADVRIIQGTELEALFQLFDDVQWAGYTCVRDANVADADAGEEPRPWLEMVEMRYGLDPAFRGSGIATRSAAVAMQWAAEEHGVRRFVAESQKPNAKSAQVLERLGFKRSGTNYFKDEGCIEWEKEVV